MEKGKESNSDNNRNNLLENETKTEQLNANENEIETEQEQVNMNKETKGKDNEEQIDKQLNSNNNNDLNKQTESNNQPNTNTNPNNNEYLNQRESNGIQEKKTDNDLLENLSNDSFEKKYNMLHEKLFNRQGRPMITEDRLNLNMNMNSKGLTVNPKLEEIFAMIGAKDFKRELRELNRRPEYKLPDTRNNRFEIRNIQNYSPLKEIRHLSQNQDKQMTYTSVINPLSKYDQLKTTIHTACRGSVDKTKRQPFPSIAVDKIVPRKRDPLFNKEYFKAELTSLNQKLFGNEVMRNKKLKENFYL